MGRGGPLDHSELREVEQMLDKREIAAAQRRLAALGERAELTHGVSYLTARLLHARGRLDLAGMADRLRELLAARPDFPEAAALLKHVAAGRSGPSKESAPPAASAALPALESTIPDTNPDPGTPVEHLSAPAIDTSSARAASWPPKPPRTSSSAPPARATGAPASPRRASKGAGRAVSATPLHPPETVRASPRAPKPASASADPRSPARGSFEPEANGAPSTKGRQFRPVAGLDSYLEKRGEPSNAPSPRLYSQDIPRAPALPQFRDNSAPPSYAPGRVEPELDPFRSKSLLPRNAGRYSEAPSATDVIKQRRPSRPPPGTPRKVSSRPPRAKSPKPAPRETVPHTPHRIRSGAPPRENPSLPTLFDIATWIDEGRHRDAIAAINRAGPNAGPEYGVLRARALAGAGYVDQAFDALQQLESEPGLDPELRAACARLFVELGDPDRGILLARQAMTAAPDRALIRLTYALAAVRSARRKPAPALLDQADRALERLEGREGPLPGFYQALKGCIQAGVGDPERAISIAQRALGLDPRSPDALAAIAEASARLSRAHEARQAWSRLHEIAPEEADALARILAAHGVPVVQRASPPAPEPESPVWTSIEKDLVAGIRGSAIRGVERAADETARRMAKSASQSGLTAVASVAASFLTTTPVLSSFAPYDASLFSLRRVDAAFDVLYGAERRPHPQTEDASIVLLLGAYVGETLRHAYGGHWEGGIAEPDGARVVVGDRQVYPFRVVSARIRQGRRATIADAVAGALPRPGTDALQSRFTSPVAARVPWAPRAWPKPSEMAALGRSITKSPIGKYCEEFAEGPLDRTTSSLIALDTYLSLVAPVDAPFEQDAAWMRRIAVLAGGYVGETLRELVGGEWVFGVDSADDALAFRLKLRGTVEVLPVAHVLERVSGARSSSLVDYAKTLMRRAERS